MKCGNCSSPNASDAAFCSACGHRLGLSCPNCSSPYDEGAAFCSRCGEALPTVEVPGPSGDLTRYVPAELLEKLQSVRRGRTMAGERRMVTMLFADVQGSTAAAEQLDPEEWADIVNGAFERLIRPVYRYEGTLARLMGDGVLAFFGAPIAHEDDPERAVRTGLEMLAGVRPYADEVAARWGVDFDLRVGINTGLVVVGEVGSDLRVEYTAVGDAVNLAARMEQSADPGTLMISAATRRLLGDGFELEELDPITVKGKSDPVAAYRVIGSRRAPDRPAGSGVTPLVGREAEMDALRRVTEEVREGKGQIVSIVGEAGIGKSRLVEALLDDLHASRCVVPWEGSRPVEPDRMRWASVRCLSYNTAVSYAPFSDMFGSIFGIDPNDPADSARRKVASSVQALGLGEEAGRVITYLCVLLGLDPLPQEEGVIADLPAPTLQRRVFGAVIDYVRACASSSPVMLVFDDLQWADSISLVLLEELLAATDRTMLGVIALMRPYREDPAWRFHETAQRSFSHRYTLIDLEPLGAGESLDLLRGLLDEDLASAVATAVLERAEGNPFFVEEIARELIEGGSRIGADGMRGDAVVPGNVSALLTSRLDRLSGTSRTTVQLASVLGRQFRFEELSTLVGDLESTEEAIADLLRRDLVVERSRLSAREYAFRHALIQETAYSTILLKDRRALHAQVADYLETGDPEPQEIARHLLESQQESRAAPYLVEAAERAARTMNLAEAIRLFDRALGILDGSDADLSLRAYDGLGSAFMLIPDLTKASASYQRMLEFGRDCSRPSAQITALNRLGAATAFLGGDLERATDYLDQARHLAEETGDALGLAEYHMNSCMVATTRGDLETAAEHDAETARLGEQAGSDYVRIGGLLQRAQTLVYGAHFEEGRRAVELAHQATEGIDDPTVRSKLAAADVYLALHDGDVSRAWELARGAADAAREAGSSTASVVSLHAGRAAAAAGDPENALSYYADSMRMGEELDQPFNSAAAAAAMVQIYRELEMSGDEIEGLRSRAMDFLEAPLGRMLASTVHCHLGWAALEDGDLDGATEHFEIGAAGSSATKHLETPGLLAGLALARARDGDLVAASARLEAAAEFTQERGMTWMEPLISMVRGSVHGIAGETEEAARAFTAGAVRARELGMADLQWRLLAESAGALRSLGREAEAAAAEEEAEVVIEEIERLFADDRLRRAFGRSARERVSAVAGADAT